MFEFSVALRPQRPYRPLGTGSPGRPPRLSHTAPELCGLARCVLHLKCPSVVWLPVLLIFNVHTDVDVCDDTWGAGGVGRGRGRGGGRRNTIRESTMKVDSGRDIPCPTGGIEPATAARRTRHSTSRATSPPCVNSVQFSNISFIPRAANPFRIDD